MTSVNPFKSDAAAVNIDAWGSKTNGNDCYWNIAANQVAQKHGLGGISAANDKYGAEVAELTAQLQELNNNKAINEGEQVYIPAEYAVEELTQSVTDATTAMSTAQSEVSTARTNLSSASKSVQSALSTLNSTPKTKDETTKDEKGNETTKEVENPDYAAAKAAYDAALAEEQKAQQALTDAQDKLKTAQDDLKTAQDGLKDAQTELKEDEKENADELKKIDGQINAVEEQIKAAEQTQKEEQAKIDAAQQAAEQNQQAGKDLGFIGDDGKVISEEDAKKLELKDDDVKKAAAKTSSVTYVPTVDGQERQVITYADGSSEENNEHKDKNGVIFFGATKGEGEEVTDEDGNSFIAYEKDDAKSSLKVDANGNVINQETGEPNGVNVKGTGTSNDDADAPEGVSTDTSSGNAGNDNKGDTTTNGKGETIQRKDLADYGKDEENGDSFAEYAKSKGIDINTASVKDLQDAVDKYDELINQKHEFLELYKLFEDNDMVSEELSQKLSLKDTSNGDGKATMTLTELQGWVGDVGSFRTSGERGTGEYDGDFEDRVPDAIAQMKEIASKYNDDFQSKVKGVTEKYENKPKTTIEETDLVKKYGSVGSDQDQNDTFKKYLEAQGVDLNDPSTKEADVKNHKEKYDELIKEKTEFFELYGALKDLNIPSINTYLDSTVELSDSDESNKKAKMTLNDLNDWVTRVGAFQTSGEDGTNAYDNDFKERVPSATQLMIAYFDTNKGNLSSENAKKIQDIINKYN